jgi:hypothetical protein
MPSDQDGADVSPQRKVCDPIVKMSRRQCSKLQTQNGYSHSPRMSSRIEKFQACQGTLPTSSSSVLCPHSWSWVSSAFHFECSTPKFEIKNAADSDLNSVHPGMPIAFSNENTECLLVDQCEDKYSYWDVRSFDLRRGEGDDPVRPQESCVLMFGQLRHKVHET